MSFAFFVLTMAASAQVRCDSGAEHTSLARALADPGCAEVRLDRGVHREEVVVRRSVTLSGAGAEHTWIACDDGPCVTVLPGVAVAIRDLTMASQQTAFASWLAHVTFERVVITAVGERGGWLKLDHTDAWLRDVDIDVSGRRPLQISAVSTRGHDLEFDGARFHGIEPASGTMSAVYSIAYGVTCTRCSFHPGKRRLQPPEPLLELDDGVHHAADIDTREARWPQLYCPAPGSADRTACTEQCGETEEVAQCRMAWDDRDESCHPSAVCVPAGERMPEVPIQRMPKSRGFR